MTRGSTYIARCMLGLFVTFGGAAGEVMALTVGAGNSPYPIDGAISAPEGFVLDEGVVTGVNGGAGIDAIETGSAEKHLYAGRVTDLRLGGGGAIVKTGTGVVTFAGGLATNGTTKVQEGTLNVQGSLSALSGFLVHGGTAIIEGSNGSVRTNEHLAVGHPVLAPSGSMLVVDQGNVVLRGTASLYVDSGSVVAFSNGARLSTEWGLVVLQNGGELVIGGVDDADAAGYLDLGHFTAIQGGGLSTPGGSVRFNHTTSDYLFGVSIEGPQKVFHDGPGSTILAHASSYNGGTIISSGTLVARANDAVGNGVVEVRSGGTFVVESGYSVENQVIFRGGSMVKKADSGAELSSLFPVLEGVNAGSEARFLDGVLTASASVGVTFKTESGALNDLVRKGDILTVEGIDGTTFVLSLSVAEITPGAMLGWLDPETNQWVNAVDGNHTTFSHFVGDVAYDASVHFVLGYYGYDSASGAVWAVLDHNSEFSVVPEPSLVGVIGGLLGFLFLKRRKSGVQHL